MSMILCLRTVSDATLDQLLLDPESINALLDEQVEEEDAISDEGLSTDLDKSWHAIHYLLTDSVWEGTGPEAFLLVGGRSIGNVDLGYGPARGMTAFETREVATALGNLPTPTLLSRYDAAKLDAAEIYPQIWVRDGELGIEYVAEFYESLRSFVATASQKNMGMLVFMT